MAALLVALIAAPVAHAQPQPYGTNDGGGFNAILPPGENGLDNDAQLAQFEASHQYPPHANDQLAPYANLLSGYPSLTNSTLGNYYGDATFGVRPGQLESSEQPEAGVTIERDRRFGIPHIYGDTRAETEFGIGYATAEDRLFFIDVLRHLGRAQLSSFIGGSAGDQALDAEIWAVGPYTEQDLVKQYEYSPPGYQTQAAQLRSDVDNYVAGINAYIAKARLNPSLMPGEYAAIGKPTGPANFNPEDVIATATVVGAIFGVGGGGEIESALALEDAQAHFGKKRGLAVWRDFREANDPEAPTTVRGRKFPYEIEPKHPKGTALPDPGSIRDLNTANPSTPGQADQGASGGGSAIPVPQLPFGLGSLSAAVFDHGHSNALVVSGRDSVSGHPLAVFGPQVSYFTPEILMEQDIHGPGLDATGAAFPGTNLYVELGHGRDYAWSATSAGQDIVDTFALPLCAPNGGKPTIDSSYYLYRGRCLQLETLTRTNSWTPNAADQTPPGTKTLTAQRSALGLVIARGKVHGRPVIYTSARTTYMHEVDSALGFSELNNPNVIRGPRAFQHAMNFVGYTFNWFYVDPKHTAYFNSGFNPVRPRRADVNLPVSASDEWRGYNPATRATTYEPFRTHPQAIDQAWMTSWNNKQAPETASADNNWGFGTIYRSQMLSERIQADLRHHHKMTLVQLAKAMEDAATVDLRGDRALPVALSVLNARPRRSCRRVRRHGHAPRVCKTPRYHRPKILRDPAVRRAMALLAAWHKAGSHRRETRPGSHVYAFSRAIQLMDAWWPRWLAAQFEPTLGKRLYDQIGLILPIDNPPNNGGQHLGSAYQDGWWGYAQKDLRSLLGERVKGRYSRVYCGGGNLARCQAALASSLKAALAVPASRLYQDPGCANAGMQGSQWCYDTIAFRALGAITQPLIAWQDRPTFQQAVSVQHYAPR